MKSDGVDLTLAPLAGDPAGDQSVVFSDWELPEVLPLPGSQALVRHDLGNGLRVIDAMGAMEGDIVWDGHMRGYAAETRARRLMTLRQQGQVLRLTWGEWSYQVIISEFTPVWRQFYEIPYRIALAVVANDTLQQPYTVPSTQQQMDADAAKLSQVAGGLTLSSVVTALSAVQKAYAAYRAIKNGGNPFIAAQSLLGAAGTLGGVAAQVSGSSMLGEAAATLKSSISTAKQALTIAGTVTSGVKLAMAGGGSPGALISSLSTTADQLSSMSLVQDATGYLGRMGGNLESDISSGLHSIWNGPAVTPAPTSGQIQWASAADSAA